MGVGAMQLWYKENCEGHTDFLELKSLDFFKNSSWRWNNWSYNEYQDRLESSLYIHRRIGMELAQELELARHRLRIGSNICLKFKITDPTTHERLAPPSNIYVAVDYILV